MNSRLYVGNYDTSNISIVDTATGSLLTRLPTGDRSPNGVAGNPLTNMVYVANGNSYSVGVIDANTNGLADTIIVGACPWDVAVNPYTKKIYVVNMGYWTVSAISGYTNRVVATPWTDFRPTMVAVNPYTNKIYVADHGSWNEVTVIDGATNTVIATLTVGTNPDDGIVIDTATNQVYVTKGSSNTLSVIQDGYAPGVVATHSIN